MKTLRHVWSFIEGRLIDKRLSEISGELEVWYQNGRLVLHSPDANYSYDTLHRVFQKGFSKIELQNRKLQNVLVLGFGAGSVASILFDEFKMNVHLTGVEVDPVVIALGKQYFNTGRFTSLDLIMEDAGVFVSGHRRQYDLIVQDVFVDKNVPDKLTGKEYIEGLIKLTSPGGIGFYNFIVEDHKQQQQRKLLELHFACHPVKLKSYNFSSVNRSLIWERL